MKTIKKFVPVIALAFSFITLLPYTLQAQYGEVKPAHQSVFAEIGGNSIFFTLNYDTRFSNRPDGLGIRIGIGGMKLGGEDVDVNFFSVPVGLNYLAGKNGKYFEGGLGVTYCQEGGNENGSRNTLGIMTFGFRYQPVGGGFTFRAAMTPIFGNIDGEMSFWPLFGGISVGHAF